MFFLFFFFIPFLFLFSKFHPLPLPLLPLIFIACHGDICLLCQPKSTTATTSFQCVAGHTLRTYITPCGGTCDICYADKPKGTEVLDCRKCNYWMCLDCRDIKMNENNNSGNKYRGEWIHIVPDGDFEPSLVRIDGVPQTPVNRCYIIPQMNDRVVRGPSWQ